MRTLWSQCCSDRAPLDPALGQREKVEQMGFRFANVEGRAALIHADHYYDLFTLSDGSLPHDPTGALGHAAELSTLSLTLGNREPSGFVFDVVLGPPVPRPQKAFGIGLNYPDHAAEGSMQVPKNPLVFPKFPSCLVGPTADAELC